MQSDSCKYEVCTNALCQFRHGEVNTDVIENVSEHSESDEESEELVENQCHLCMKMCDNNDLLFGHFETEHNRFYVDIMNRRIAENLL